jgi:hypothetical protein
MKIGECKIGDRIRLTMGGGFSSYDDEATHLIATILSTNPLVVGWKKGEKTTLPRMRTDVSGFEWAAYWEPEDECTYEDACPQCGLIHQEVAT